MREIKFRGKRINGEWVYGDLLQGLYGDVYIVITHENGVTKYEVQNDTVGQLYRTTYCGTPAPVDIFEGDIVKGYQPYHEDSPIVGQIIWRDEGFRLLTTDNYIDTLTVFTIKKKLGNIHDNPDLMKKENKMYIVKNEDGRL